MVGEHFDTGRAPGDKPGEADGSKSRYLGVHFACCAVYARVYVNRQGTHYIGHCPRCGRRVEFRIEPGGTDHRFFTAY